MKSTNINNAIKEVRELFNELRSNETKVLLLVKKQSKLEKNYIKKKMFIIF